MFIESVNRRQSAGDRIPRRFERLGWKLYSASTSKE
jgi:hypothetical protein